MLLVPVMARVRAGVWLSGYTKQLGLATYLGLVAVGMRRGWFRAFVGLLAGVVVVLTVAGV